DSVLQPLPGLELRLLRSRDLNLFAGSRIAPFGRGALRYGERAEANQPYLIALLQGRRDRVEDAVDGLARIAARQASTIGDNPNKFVFIHVEYPPRIVQRK